MKNNNLSLQILFLFILLFNLFVTAPAYAGSSQDFISKQKTIRIVADDAPGFGDQAASYNIVYWLREKQNYTGYIEFVYGYGAETKGKIISLFNLSKDIPDDWSDTRNKIRFIRKNIFITLNKNKDKNKAIDSVPLGINGGSSDVLCGSSSYTDAGFSKNDTYANLYTEFTALECNNFANFYNTDIFIEVKPYPEPANKSIGTVSLRDQAETQIETGNASIPVKINNTYVPVAVNDIAEARKLAENNADLLHRLPALTYFIDSIINQDFNVLPVYGDTVRTASYNPVDPDSFYVGNMLQIITAAYYAQQKGLEADKPLIIAVFYNYDQEAHKLNAIIHDDNWEGLLDKPGAVQARAIIKQFNLQNVFSVASLSQTETITLLKRIKESKKPGQIILLSIGASLPKDIFDGIYAHTGTNVWPQIREGANSFNSLVTTGKPHFRCAGPAGNGNGNGWEIGYDLMTDVTLKNRFNNLYLGRDIKSADDNGTYYKPNYDNEFCGGMITWQAHSLIYQELGDLFIEAANPNSALSRYFQLLKSEATKPENDRISHILEFGLKLYHP